MKTRITLLILSCAALITSLITGGTMAWFTDAIAKEIIFETGAIKYTITGNLVGNGDDSEEDEYTIVVPGQHLTDNEGNMTLVNKSTIDTELRMQILYSYEDVQPDGTVIYHENIPYSPEDEGLTHYLDFDLNSKWIFAEEPVSGNPDDGIIKCFEFEYKTDDFTLPKVDESSPGDEIPLLEGITFSGTKITPEFSGTTFSLKLFFQVKQKNIATWQDLGVLDFYVSH